MPFPENPKDFLDAQANNWPLYADNLALLSETLASASTFTLPESGWSVTTLTLSYRRASISADIARVTAGLRPCFLCAHARPALQSAIPWGDYEILANPYPLGANHLTIPAVAHTPQLLTPERVTDMLRLASLLPSLAIFYNGPRCGASAPDHFHFQAIDRPLASNLLSTPLTPLDTLPGVSLSSLRAPYSFLTIDADTPVQSAEAISHLLSLLPKSDTDPEPPLNLFAIAIPGRPTPRLYVIPRRRHRPGFYGDSPGQILVSPASLEMAGLFVTPQPDHTRRITPSIIFDIYREVAYSHNEIISLCNRQSR